MSEASLKIRRYTRTMGRERFQRLRDPSVGGSGVKSISLRFLIAWRTAVSAERAWLRTVGSGDRETEEALWLKFSEAAHRMTEVREEETSSE